MIRERNPDTWFASWASSAPVEAQVDMSVYYNPMQQVSKLTLLIAQRPDTDVVSFQHSPPRSFLGLFVSNTHLVYDTQLLGRHSCRDRLCGRRSSQWYETRGQPGSQRCLFTGTAQSSGECIIVQRHWALSGIGSRDDNMGVVSGYQLCDSVDYDCIPKLWLSCCTTSFLQLPRAI